ncbi:AlpA family phage regulatory protein [Zoogloea sp.]|uniref:helix-turn-helix transcriptional regulator n=1 Tax=Zoogloea sp. TaxID=49181 RepID=UPI002625A47A|nr:AlpA family phage regulatory protein [Zoogloea sp.]MDD3354157.1 AlpA family phage regulatory protein [Zoogloea sp.]
MKIRPIADKTTPASHLPDPAAPPIPDALRNFDALPDAANVRLPVVCALFGISPPTAWRWVKKSKLPAGRKLSERVTAWNVGELRKALNGEAWQ